MYNVGKKYTAKKSNGFQTRQCANFAVCTLNWYQKYPEICFKK